MKRIIKWSEREFSFNQRFFATISAGVLFLFLIPVLLIRGLPAVDKMIGLPSLSFGIINVVVGGIMVSIGATYALWSIISHDGENSLITNDSWKIIREEVGDTLTV